MELESKHAPAPLNSYSGKRLEVNVLAQYVWGAGPGSVFDIHGMSHRTQMVEILTLYSQSSLGFGTPTGAQLASQCSHPVTAVITEPGHQMYRLTSQTSCFQTKLHGGLLAWVHAHERSGMLTSFHKHSRTIHTM